MTEEAKEARREYLKQYREKNRDHINEYARNWRKTHPEQQEAINERYWLKKAAEMKEAAANND